MKKFFDYILNRKSKIPQNSTIVEQPTQPISSVIVKKENDLVKEQIYPPQFLVGIGQSVGRSRDHNEDTIFSLTSVLSDIGTPQSFGLFIVADGMGGHSHGEIASAAAVRAVVDYLFSNLFSRAILEDGFRHEKSIHEILEAAVQSAQNSVVKQAPGGGTTLTMALVINNQISLAHVGDSRGYLIDKSGKINQLTQDHSLVRRLVDLGQLTEEQSKTFPQKNVLYRALGQAEPLIPDLQTFSLPEEGILLLCSDGLWGVVGEEEIVSIVFQNPDPITNCQKLVEAANAVGGPDNISVILAKFLQ